MGLFTSDRFTTKKAQHDIADHRKLNPAAQTGSIAREIAKQVKSDSKVLSDQQIHETRRAAVNKAKQVGGNPDLLGKPKQRVAKKFKSANDELANHPAVLETLKKLPGESIVGTTVTTPELEHGVVKDTTGIRLVIGGNFISKKTFASTTEAMVVLKEFREYLDLFEFNGDIAYLWKSAEAAKGKK